MLLDKYLGDALYAVMIYSILRLRWQSRTTAGWAAVLMLAIESFQLTSIAANMLKSEQLMVRVVARLLGTHFSFLDLAAYGVAIGCLYLVDSRGSDR